MKRNLLRWFGHIERMESEEFVKIVYMSEGVGPNSKGKLPGRWRDRIKEHCVREVLPEGEGWIKQGGSVWTERWRLFCCGHPLGGRSQREGGVRAMH